MRGSRWSAMHSPFCCGWCDVCRSICMKRGDRPMRSAKGIYLDNVKSASTAREAEKMLEGLVGLDLDVRGIVFYKKFDEQEGYYLDSADLRLLNARLQNDETQHFAESTVDKSRYLGYQKLVGWLNNKIALEPDKIFNSFNTLQYLDLETSIVQKLTI